MGDVWDLSQYGVTQKPWSPSGSTSQSWYDKLAGRTTTTSKSGNATFSTINPGGLYDQVAKASNQGQIDGATNPYVWPNGWPTPTTTTSGGGGGGGGGGGYAAPDYSSMSKWMAAAKPEMLNLPDYKPPEFYKFSEEPYTTAKEGIKTGIADSRQRGNTALDLAANRYLNYQDPYAGGPQTYNPGVDPRLMDSMAAWGGAGSNAAAQTYNEGVQADAAMGSVYDLLSNVGRQFNEQQLAGIEGDRMQLDQGLGSEERMLNLGVDMALTQARAQYKKDKWLFGEQVARQNYETNVAQIMANNQTKNQWNEGILDMVLQMVASGGTNVPTDPSGVMT